MGKLMSQKEVKRAHVLDMLEEDKISQQEASKRIGVGTRQVRRLSKRYRAEGLGGLVSKKRGRVSNQRLDEVARTTAIELIGTHYRDFGPTLANEKLAELHGIQLSVESTRQLMIGAGYWRTRRGGTVCAHPMRERRARFGELIQIDGSPHDWFEGRGEYCTLLVFIDDATGRLTQLRFTPTETTLGTMRVLHDHIRTHGPPVTLYSDRHSVFHINAKDADPEAETQFARAARELGIECIPANTPQAKGCVGARQPDLAGSVGQGNAAGWHKRYGQRQRMAAGLHCGLQPALAVVPKDPSDAHLAYPGTSAELVRTLSVQVTRTLSKNLSCQYENQLLQIKTMGTGLGLGERKSRCTNTLTGEKSCYGKSANWSIP